MTDLNLEAIRATVAGRCMPYGCQELFGKALVPIERETIDALVSEIERLRAALVAVATMAASTPTASRDNAVEKIVRAALHSQEPSE